MHSTRLPTPDLMEIIPAALLDDLKRFARIVWGNPQALLRGLPPRGVEFIDLGEYFAAFRHLFAGILRHDKILVRNEYRTALQAILQSDRYRSGTYVIGQPGIGKTYFLVYALVQLLSQEQSAALQLLNGDAFYVLFKDTGVTLHSLMHASPLYECPFVWGLCDSNDVIQHPIGAFRGDPDRIRIIQTTPPRASRWKGWSKQLCAEPYIMDIWSEEEIMDLAMLFGLNVEHMSTLAKKWGGIPRTLLQCVCMKDWQVDDWYRTGAKVAVEQCKIMMSGGVELNFPHDPPFPFYFLRPKKTPAGGISRTRPLLCVPTRTLRCFLAEALQAQRALVKLEFYHSLSQYAETRQAANFIYESWFHNFFSAQRDILCQWVAPGSNKDKLWLPTTPRLGGSTVLLPTTWDAVASRTPPYYWIAPYSKFSGINSAIILETQIFVFQVTTGSDHRSPIKGLQKLRKYLPQDLKNQNLLWKMVFIGPEDEPIKHVAEAWADKLFFPTRRTCMSVGWSAVDPVQSDVVYRVYRDESDPVLKEPDEEMMEVEEE